MSEVFAELVRMHRELAPALPRAEQAAQDRIMRQRDWLLQGAPALDAGDYFTKRRLVPIGTRKPWVEYEDGKVPMDDVVTLSADPRKPLNVAVVAPSGIGKTQLVKVICESLQEMRWHLLIFEPVGKEWQYAGQPGDARNLLPDQSPKGMRIVNAMPRFVATDLLESDPDELANYHLFAHDISKIAEFEFWTTAGVSIGTAQNVIDFIKNNPKIKDPQEIAAGMQNLRVIDEFSGKSRLKYNRATTDAVLKIVRNFINFHYFDRKQVKVGGKIVGMQRGKALENLDILGLWRKRYAISVSYHEKDMLLARLSVGLIYRRFLEQYGALTKEEREGGFFAKKMFVFEDMLELFTQANADESTNLAFAFARHILFFKRKAGLHMIAVPQDIDTCPKIILKHCQTRLVGPVPDPEGLREIIGLGNVRAIKRNEAESYPKQFLYKWRKITGNAPGEDFWPLQPRCGHKYSEATEEWSGEEEEMEDEEPVEDEAGEEQREEG